MKSMYNKGKVFAYWELNEKNNPPYWKDGGEYNIGEMVDMAMDKFDAYLFEDTIEIWAWEYASKH